MKSAVVVGGSLAGLLAARVLANHFRQVTVVERDPEPTTIEPRHYVPQGNHAHALLMSGARIVDELFPGISAELVAGGAVPFDFSADVLWHLDSVLQLRYPSEFDCLSMSRPFFEEKVRRRLTNYSNVDFRYGSSVSGLIADADNGRIVGVGVQARAEKSAVEKIPADLIVDAGGRGSKARGWLGYLGYPQPPQSTVKFGLGYASQLYERRPPTTRDWKVTAVHPHRPNETRGVILMPIEGDRWILTLQTYSAVKPPQNESDLLEYLRSLPRREAFDEIKNCVPLGPINAYNYAGQVRHRFARLAKLPEGFIAIGDAVCSFDPVFGQGMSVLAKEAQILDNLLRSRTHLPEAVRLAGLPRAYFRGIDKVIDNVWLLTSNEAFKYPSTTGDRPLGAGSVLQWYTAQLFQLISTDRRAYDAFIRSMHLIAPPTVLFQPAVLGKVLARQLTSFQLGRKVAVTPDFAAR